MYRESRRMQGRLFSLSLSLPLSASFLASDGGWDGLTFTKFLGIFQFLVFVLFFGICIIHDIATVTYF